MQMRNMEYRMLAEEQNLETAQRIVKRPMLGITKLKQISNADLRTRFDLKSIAEMICATNIFGLIMWQG